MKLSAWAKQQGIHYQTAWRWFQAGQIEGAYKTESGTILVPDAAVADTGRVAVHVIVLGSACKDSEALLLDLARKLKDIEACL